MKSITYHKYASIILIAGSLVWFLYLHFSAESRVRQAKQSIYRVVEDGFPSNKRDRIAVNWLEVKSADMIQEMLFPFVFMLVGFSHLLVYQRKIGSSAASDG